MQSLLVAFVLGGLIGCHEGSRATPTPTPVGSPTSSLLFLYKQKEPQKTCQKSTSGENMSCLRSLASGSRKRSSVKRMISGAVSLLCSMFVSFKSESNISPFCPEPILILSQYYNRRDALSNPKSQLHLEPPPAVAIQHHSVARKKRHPSCASATKSFSLPTHFPAVLSFRKNDNKTMSEIYIRVRPVLAHPPSPSAAPPPCCVRAAGSGAVEIVDPANRSTGTTVQEAKNRSNIALQEKFHRGILEGVRNISDTL